MISASSRPSSALRSTIVHARSRMAQPLVVKGVPSRQHGSPKSMQGSCAPAPKLQLLTSLSKVVELQVRAGQRVVECSAQTCGVLSSELVVRPELFVHASNPHDCQPSVDLQRRPRQKNT
jgi:hypothetical protein